MSVKKRVLAAAAASAMVVGGTTFAIAANPAPESYAFVARGDDHADALAASALAGRLNAPVVLTPTSSLHDAGRAALQAANPDNVIIAGGTAAIDADVESQIRSLLPAATVERVFGPTRFETAQELAAKFPQIPASFLAVDGKANAAEEADHAADADHATMADDSAMFGGLTPTEYQHTWVNHPAGVGNIATSPIDDDDQGLGALVDPMTIEVPVDGFLDASGLGVSLNEDAGGDGVDDYDDLDTVLVLMDYAGDFTTDTQAENMEFLNSLVYATDQTGATLLNLPKKVAAGTHTVELVGFFSPPSGAPDGDGDGDPELIGTSRVALRHLTVNVTSGITGTYKDWTLPPGTFSSTTDHSERVSQLLGRD